MATLNEKIGRYQTLVLDILEEHARLHPEERELEDQIIADTHRNHFQLIRLGWRRGKRIAGVILHFDIKPDGKIWVQTNWTEDRVGEELVKKGVPRTDIVLGLQPPEARPLTAFAAA